ncbi:MAG: anthranilate phosphoribosyltransferase [candidate division WOR-3 bacterium]
MNNKGDTKISEALKKVVENVSLSSDEAYAVALEIMDGDATPAQLGALITALRMKGETVEEITGFCQALRARMVVLECPIERLIDTCGTGGDATRTFNISTTAAFIAAGAGCFVAKHGNRSVSSLCGSADLFTSLALDPEMEYHLIKRCIEKIGIGFLYAPKFHPAMKNVAQTRREIGIRTIFNILGPLCNPAQVKYQVIGVCKKELLDKIAKVLVNLGTKHALVVHGQDGMDELTLTTGSYVWEVVDQQIVTYEVNPEDFGLKKCSLDELQVKNLQDNRDAFLEVLNGASGPKTDIAILNAAAAIYVAGKSKTLKEGVAIAREVVYSGAAWDKFNELRTFIDGYVKKDS